MHEFTKIINDAKKQLAALAPKLVHFGTVVSVAQEELEDIAYRDRMDAVGLWHEGLERTKGRRTKSEIFAASMERKSTNLPRIAKCSSCQFKSKKVFDDRYPTVHRDERVWERREHRNGHIAQEVLVCPECGMMIYAADYDWDYK